MDGVPDTLADDLQMITFIVQQRRAGSPRKLLPLYVNLQRDLQEFLGTLTRFSAVAQLADLDIYDDTYIEGEQLNELTGDLSALGNMLNQGTIELRVPEEVGTTSIEDMRQEFGLEGFRRWVRDLHTLCEMAKARSTPLRAAGD